MEEGEVEEEEALWERQFIFFRCPILQSTLLLPFEIQVKRKPSIFVSFDLL